MTKEESQLLTFRLPVSVLFLVRAASSVGRAADS